MVIKGQRQLREEKASNDEEEFELSTAKSPKFRDKHCRSQSDSNFQGNSQMMIGHLEDDLHSNLPISIDETCHEPMPLSTLVFLFLEKFVEIVVVFLLTLLAVLWQPLYSCLYGLYWPLLGFACVSMITLVFLHRMPWFTRCPGFLVFKLLYFCFLVAVFFLLAVHVPIAFKFLNPYFALVAVGSVAATYFFFAFITLTHAHVCGTPAKGCYVWLVILAMPVGILIINQPVYFSGTIWHFQDYWDFIVNVAAGILMALPFCCEALYIYQRFINSTDSEEFLNTPGLVPGFVTVFLYKKLNQNLEMAREQAYRFE